MNIILFNGPPGCGKDTAAKFLYHNWNGIDGWEGFPGYPIFDRLSMPIKAAFAGMTSTDAFLDGFGNNKIWEPKKDSPHELLQGKSYRQWQMAFSEDFMKPHFGEAIFAELFCNRNAVHRDGPFTLLVPDCGFDIEAKVIIDRFPRANILLIKIFRPGKDFTGDSRKYIDTEACTVEYVYNISTVEIFTNKISTIVRSHIK